MNKYINQLSEWLRKKLINLLFKPYEQELIYMGLINYAGDLGLIFNETAREDSTTVSMIAGEFIFKYEKDELWPLQIQTDFFKWNLCKKELEREKEKVKELYKMISSRDNEIKTLVWRSTVK